ncbi:MAG: exodeoxyribonuclease small subunit [Acidobacteriota bacterium]|nr:exodeoxyribonuclease small subunit [Acidobacteriota bacterium]
MKIKKAEAQNQNFEASLAALEKIVRELERGELPLEKSLELFERGVRLSRECQERLQEAERRIEVLLQRDGEGRASVFGALGGEDFDAPTTTGDAKDDAEDDESVF